MNMQFLLQYGRICIIFFYFTLYSTDCLKAVNSDNQEDSVNVAKFFIYADSVLICKAALKDTIVIIQLFFFSFLKCKLVINLLQRNTFQLVVANMKSASYAILLYPEENMQFGSTLIDDEDQPVEVGFNEGKVPGWFSWGSTQGIYYRITEDSEESINALAQ